MKSQLSEMEREKIAIERKFAALRDEVSDQVISEVLQRSISHMLDPTARARATRTRIADRSQDLPRGRTRAPD